METPTVKHRLPPSLADIEEIAAATIAALPEPFRAQAQALILRVEEFAPDALLSELSMDNAFDLTGLYDGTPLTQKSTADQPHGPDMVWLFRRPILDEWAERGNVSLEELVAHVTVHEVAHHFGWSDEDIASIDRWWE